MRQVSAQDPLPDEALAPYWQAVAQHNQERAERWTARAQAAEAEVARLRIESDALRLCIATIRAALSTVPRPTVAEDGYEQATL